MTKEKYEQTLNRIEELQNCKIQPLPVTLGWELNDLLKQVVEYENIIFPEILAKAEVEAEWNAYWKAIPSWVELD